MHHPLSGKVALITGASSGIGAATARRLAAAGVRVGIAARRTDRLAALGEQIIADGGEALAIGMDVGDPASVAAGVSRLVDTFGTLDILVNNAGLMPVSHVDELRVDDWRNMVDVNIQGVLNATAAVLPRMMAQRGGHIFNISSIAGRKVMPGLAVYSACKFAVAAFSEGLRMELGSKHNIRVTCIQPGAVATELYEQTTDPVHRQMLDDFGSGITVLDAADIGDCILFAAQAPAHVNIAELFVLPTEQA